MVIWVFAGGGETELNGMIPFLETNYPQHRFKRYTPARNKPGPKPNCHINAFGRTGVSLARQVEEIFPIAWRERDERCDVVLILDDLDCHDPNTQRDLFADALQMIQKNCIKGFVAFAAPEIEAWIIADWSNTFKADSEFGKKEACLRYRLSSQGISFENPEEFGNLNPEKNSCDSKLSEVLQKEVFECYEIRYSKKDHSARLLACVRSENVSSKCPEFRKMHDWLQQELP